MSQVARYFYNYDGFGNLTAITGTQANSWSYDPATNHGPYSDANGNGMSAASGGAYTYDVENRIIATGAANGSYTYGYAPGNKRLWRANFHYDSNFQQQMPTTDEITFWSPRGQKLATYQLGIQWTTSSADGTACVTSFYATQTATNYYFGGKRIKNAPGNVFSDRLGSIGKYYPYGTDRSGTPSSGEKFTGYNQDSETGLDYAVNRYQQPGSGRFLTPDPYMASGGPGDPGSWNRYAYTRGDPVNRFDPRGLQDLGIRVDDTFPLPGNPDDPNNIGGGGGGAHNRLSTPTSRRARGRRRDVPGGTTRPKSARRDHPWCSELKRYRRLGHSDGSTQ